MPSFGVFVIQLLLSSVSALRNRAIGRQVYTVQVFFSGFEALGLISLVAGVLGGLVMYVGFDFFVSIGQAPWIYFLLNMIVLRDVAPFLISFILLARSGTAISTELGNMKVNKEVAALQVMGIGIMEYLVLPRVWAMVTSLFVLGCFFTAAGILSAYLVAILILNISHVEFWQFMFQAISLLDLGLMAAKLILCGFMLAALSCYFGLSVNQSVTEVPQFMIKTVGYSVLSVTLINGVGILIYLTMNEFSF